MASALTKHLSSTAVSWAFLAVLVALVPHTSRFSPWLMLAFFAMGSWRVLGAYHKVPLPDRRYISIWLLKQCVAIAIFVATYLSFDGQLGRDAGIVMLTALLGLKLLEMRTHRDFYVVMFLAYFLVVTNLFYSQTIFTAAYMFIVVIIVTAGLIHFNGAAGGLKISRCFKLSLQYCFQAVPIMIAAFILFPRIPGPLWGIPQNSVDGVTGLSDEMTIGAISRLGVSDEIAFQVAFAEQEPRAQDLYWRGPVLWETDGISWRAGPGKITNRSRERSTKPAEHKPASTFDYQIILEPHGKKWIFALDHVRSVRGSATITADERVIAQKKIATRQRFELSSDVAPRPTEISDAERQAALALPEGFHPRTLRLARQWSIESESPDAIVQRALQHFNEEAFIYTLTPAPLSSDSVDSFLFDTREGFCEYYAAAFVILMRAAEIPARVVTGYHGGEYNSLSDFMVVRQRDAHAWAEVYLTERGWVRVDPTAAVAPERLSLGLTQVFPSRRPLSMLDADHPVAFTWHQVRQLWEAVNFNWSRWVLGYSPQRQRQFLDELGFGEWRHSQLVIALTLVASTIVFLLAVVILKPKRRNSDYVAELYAVFCSKLSNAGLPRAPYEGPVDYAKRISITKKNLAHDIQKITALYVELRYSSSNNDVTAFANLVKNFNCR